LLTAFLPGEIIVGLTIASRPAAMYQIAKDLSLSGLEAGFVLGTLPLVAATLGIAIGSWTDRFGVGKLFTLGMFLNVVGNLLTAFSFEFDTVFFLSLLASLGVSLAIPSLTKTLAVLFSERERGLALGALASTVRVSAGLTLVLVPFLLISLGSWRPAFLVLGGLQLVFGVAIYVRLRRFGLQRVDSHRGEASSLRGDFAHVLRIKRVVFTALSQFFLQAAQSFASFLPFLLQLSGFSLVAAGLVSSGYWVAGAAGAIVIPRISDLVPSRARLLAVLGFPCSALAYLLTFVWGNVVLSLIVLVMIGFIFAGLFEMSWLIPLSDPEVRIRYAGAATGVLFSLGSLGGVFSNATIGWFVDAFGQNILPSLLFLSILPFSAAFVSLPIRKRVAEE